MSSAQVTKPRKERIGKYEVIRQIAIGGMAEIYLARSKAIEGFEKLVVVKRILPAHSQDQSFISMFLDEARLAATLQHPNIAQVYDIGMDEGDYFFTMEYVHGEDLRRVMATTLATGRKAPLDFAALVGISLAAGLHYAHTKTDGSGASLGIVHRDVSPANILVSYDGTIKLVDFGIAKASNTRSATGVGSLKGKITYMSPEQCRGTRDLDCRSDLFSLGSILYELTTGAPPFDAPSEYGVIHQIVNNDPEPPSCVLPGYPAALEAIVLKLMAREPADRFQSGLDAQQALEDFAHDQRLRTSNLTATRFMESLYGQRLDEWKAAREQGAFFVEEHVVKTLIRSGKTTEGLSLEELYMREAVDDEATSVTTVPLADDEMADHEDRGEPTAVTTPGSSPVMDDGPTRPAATVGFDPRTLAMTPPPPVPPSAVALAVPDEVPIVEDVLLALVEEDETTTQGPPPIAALREPQPPAPAPAPILPSPVLPELRATSRKGLWTVVAVIAVAGIGAAVAYSAGLLGGDSDEVPAAAADRSPAIEPAIDEVPADPLNQAADAENADARAAANEAQAEAAATAADSAEAERERAAAAATATATAQVEAERARAKARADARSAEKAKARAAAQARAKKKPTKRKKKKKKWDSDSVFLPVQ